MTNQVEEKVIASVIMNDGTTQLYYNDQPLIAYWIAEGIKEALEEGTSIIEAGEYKIEVNLVWAVKDWINRKLIVINENNAPVSIEEKIPHMSVRELCSTMRDTFEWLSNEEDEEERDSLIQLQDKLINRIEELHEELIINVGNIPIPPLRSRG